MKPVIGISGSILSNENDGVFSGYERAYVNDDYVLSVSRAGGIPYIIPMIDNDEDIKEQIYHVDGLILSGGYDVDPIYWGEEITSKLGRIFPRRDNHEIKIVKYALEMDHIDGAFYWCASDLFEEQVMINKPFFGGFGMINNVGIPKPGLYAFNILKDTYDDEVILDSTQAEEIEYHLFKEDENFQLLVFNQDYDYDKKEEHKITIKLKGEFKDFELKRIDDNHCNPKKIWQEMGEPKVLKDNEIIDIINVSKLKSENINVHYDNGYTIIELVMKTNDLYFYQFKK